MNFIGKTIEKLEEGTDRQRGERRRTDRKEEKERQMKTWTDHTSNGIMELLNE